MWSVTESGPTPRLAEMNMKKPRLWTLVGLASVSMMAAGTVIAAPSAFASGATTNIAVTGNPPAAKSSDSVTYSATVSDPNGIGTPTGTVTFTYQPVGSSGGVKYTLGTEPLVPVQTGTASAAITVDADAAGLPTSNPVITITASYSGDGTYAANTGTTTEYLDSTCDTNPWPSQSSGYPRVFATYPQGYYLGQVNGWWHFYVTQPNLNLNTSVKFSGEITITNGRILDVTATKNESSDVVKQIGNGELKYNFANHGSLDGFEFYAGCGDKLQFHINIAKTTAPGSEVNVGNPTTNTTSGNFAFKR